MKKWTLAFASILFSFSLFSQVQVAQEDYSMGLRANVLAQISQASEAYEFLKRQQKFYVEAEDVVNDASLLGWQFLAPADGREGSSINQVYQEHKPTWNKKEIVVAVIDGGVNVTHESFKGRLWVNKGEIPNNGIDDDGNGFVDDINGWNFIGNVSGDQLEVTREYGRLLSKYKDMTDEEKRLDREYPYYKQVERAYKKGRGESMAALQVLSEAERNMRLLAEVFIREGILSAVDFVNSTDEEIIEKLSSSDISAYESERESLILYIQNLPKNGESNFIASLNKVKARVNHYYDLNFKRRKVPGNDPSKFIQVGYGSNDVGGPDPSHGTHVAGTIAGQKGTDGRGVTYGVNVKIMAVRVVPDGDEQDKDVANGIRYAVANGADIIQMSFGKSFSSYGPKAIERNGEKVGKAGVDAAIAYAEENGVILVHSAGNSTKQNDYANNFPNRRNAQLGTKCKTWIEVGASTWAKGPGWTDLPAYFSNFGKETVDIFSPGHKIYAAYSDRKGQDTRYRFLSGTSMAGPVLSGSVALFLTQNPDYPRDKIRDLVNSSSRQYPGLKVSHGSMNSVPFANLSISGGVLDVNAMFTAGK